ncbi:MAG: VOC family protein [Chloroflexota bacterium]|nr:VOC family protein [Chloroflexota bacterium]
MTPPIAPCLWFDGKAEAAVDFHVSVFEDSGVLRVDRFSDVGPDPEGPVT